MSKHLRARRRRAIHTVLCLALIPMLFLSACGTPPQNPPAVASVTGDAENKTVGEKSEETTDEKRLPPPPSLPPVDPADTRTPAEVADAYEVARLWLARRQTVAGYRQEDAGTAVAKIGFINYTQNITALTLFSGADFYNSSYSDSAIVHSSHEVRAKGGVLTVTGEDAPYTPTAYRAVYGIVPSDALLCGFVLTEDTVLSAEKIGQTGDVLTFRYRLSPAAAEGIRTQMQKHGGLKNLPVFRDIEITLRLKSDWTPLSTDLCAVYEISLPLLGTTTCTENLHSDYTAYGKAEILP